MGFRLMPQASPLEEDLIRGVQQGGTPNYQDGNMLASLPASEFTQQAVPTTVEDYSSMLNSPRLEMAIPAKEQFRRQVGGQVADSTQAFAEGARERGALSPGVVEQYKNRGIQISGRVVAKEEFDQAVSAQNRAIKELVETAGIKDQNMKYKFVQNMREKMTQARIELLKFGQQAELQMAKMKASAEKKQAMAKALGAVAGGIMGGLIAGPGGAMVGSQLAGGAVGGQAKAASPSPYGSNTQSPGYFNDPINEKGFDVNTSTSERIA